VQEIPGRWSWKWMGDVSKRTGGKSTEEKKKRQVRDKPKQRRDTQCELQGRKGRICKSEGRLQYSSLEPTNPAKKNEIREEKKMREERNDRIDSQGSLIHLFLVTIIPSNGDQPPLPPREHDRGRRFARLSFIRIYAAAVLVTACLLAATSSAPGRDGEHLCVNEYQNSWKERYWDRNGRKKSAYRSRVSLASWGKRQTEEEDGSV